MTEFNTSSLKPNNELATYLYYEKNENNFFENLYKQIARENIAAKNRSLQSLKGQYLLKVDKIGKVKINKKNTKWNMSKAIVAKIPNTEGFTCTTLTKKDDRWVSWKNF